MRYLEDITSNSDNLTPKFKHSKYVHNQSKNRHFVIYNVLQESTVQNQPINEVVSWTHFRLLNISNVHTTDPVYLEGE